MWIKILALIMICAFTHLALADVYVITDRNNEVYSISDQNDALLPSGDTLTVLKGQNIKNLPITGNPALYTFNRGAFAVNTSAVQAAQTTQAAAVAQQTAINNAKISAIEKLTDAISKVDVNDVLTNTELQAILPGQ